MKKSFTMRCMLIALFTVMSMAANAEVIEYRTDDGFKYNLDTEEKTAELAKFSGSQKKVVIPESVTYNDVTYSVTSLGNACFNGCSSLTSITIPSSVTSLGDRCFNGCKSLTSIDIPSSVTSLGLSCFRGCSSLESITVDKNNKVYDSRDNCNAIIETSTNRMIRGCKTTVIPSSVTSLGFSCFWDCTSLTSITIPSSVTYLGSSCFNGCSSLESITVDKNNKVYDSRESCNAIIETSTNTMIQGCKTTVIPSSVTSLEESCFDGCSSLTSVTIPSSVTSLGNWCFEGCSSLTSITIPSSVTSLGKYCFENCSSLTSITIPSSVTSLGVICFRGCSSLTSIDIPSSVTSLGLSCF